MEQDLVNGAAKWAGIANLSQFRVTKRQAVTSAALHRSAEAASRPAREHRLKVNPEYVVG